jgi:hypothetical protein
MQMVDFRSLSHEDIEDRDIDALPGFRGVK